MWQTEAAKWKDEMMRSLADAETTRKRAQREVEVAKKYGVQVRCTVIGT